MNTLPQRQELCTIQSISTTLIFPDAPGFLVLIPTDYFCLFLDFTCLKAQKISVLPLLDVSPFIFEYLRSLLSFCKPLHFWNYCHFFFHPPMMFWSPLPVWEITDNAGTETFLDKRLHVSWVNKHFRTELTGHRFNPAGKSENPHTLHTCQSFSLAILMGLRKYSQMFQFIFRRTSFFIYILF